MLKENLLNQINNTVEMRFSLSDVIKDEYLIKKNIQANGYGIYEPDKTSVKHRYCLIVDFENNKTDKTLIALLMNPSNTFPVGLNGTQKSKFDPTIRNLIKLANRLNYEHLIVLNSFSYICGKGEDAKEFYKKELKNSSVDEINKKVIECILGNNRKKELIIACGDGVPKELYKNLLNLVQKYQNNGKLTLLTYAKDFTKNNRPRHFSLQSQTNRDNYKNAYENKCLWQLKIKHNEFTKELTLYKSAFYK